MEVSWARGTDVLIALAGAYIGGILYEVQFSKGLSQVTKKGVSFRRTWTVASCAASLAFFCKRVTKLSAALNEVAYRYFETSEIYHNPFIDCSVSAFTVYKVLHQWLRKLLLV